MSLSNLNMLNRSCKKMKKKLLRNIRRTRLSKRLKVSEKNEQMSWSQPTNKCHDGYGSQQMRWRRRQRQQQRRQQRRQHSWMIIITVVAVSSSLFAYHEFSHDTGVLFNKYTHFSTAHSHPTHRQSPVPFHSIQAKQPVSQPSRQPTSQPVS